jgi:S-adenosylmethionine synthetase
MDHLTPQNTVDPSASGKTVDASIAFFFNMLLVSRPDNSHLSVKRLEEAGIDTHFVKFATWFDGHLKLSA